MTNNILAAAATLHFKEPKVAPSARKAELESIVAIVNERRKGMKRLGEFSIAPARNDDDGRYFTQIRAMASASAGGCEFRFNLPKRESGKQDTAKIAETILGAAAEFSRLTGLAKYIGLTREIVDEVLKPAQDGLHPMKAVAIGIVMDSYGGKPKVCVDFEALGRDLCIGIDRVVAYGLEDVQGLEEGLAKYVTQHMRRSEAKVLAQASRAIGWIDEAALSILDASGLSREEAVTLLRRQECIEFSFGGDEGWDLNAALYWEDGVIKGDVENYGQGWSLEADRLKLLNCRLPDTVLTAWSGRRFGAVVEHPFVPGDAIVTAVDHGNGDWTYIDMVIGRLLVDEGTGRSRNDDRVS